MIDSHFRSFWQSLLFEPLASFFAFCRVQPAHVTLLAFIFGLLCLPALYFHERLIAVLMLLISGLLDAVDGTLARKLGTSSAGGAIMDIISDRAVEAAVVLGLYLYAPSERAILCLILLASFYLCVTTFLLSGIFGHNTSNKSFHYSAGLIERTETFIFFPVVILWDQTFFWATILFSGLVFFTSLLRLLQMLRNHP